MIGGTRVDPGEGSMSRLRSAVTVLLIAVALSGFALDAAIARPPQRAPATSSLGLRSNIGPRDEVVVIDTAARLDAAGTHWIVPLHAWVYEPEQSRVRMAIVEKIIAPALGVAIPESKQAKFRERLNLLLADNQGGRRVVVSIAGKTYTLARTKGNGHAESEVRIPRSQVDAAARDGIIDVQVLLPAGDKRVRKGSAHLIEPTGLSVISDIDDTVKITHVTDTRKMLEATFLEPFAPVPGMADLYASWRRLGSSGRQAVSAIHFVSSSPWHLYRPLKTFLDETGFPDSTMSLKMMRLKDRSILNIVKSGSETKPPQIEALLKAYPKRKFILVGDNGEEDPETYASIARKHPERIQAVYIRILPEKPQSRGDARFTRAFDGVADERWRLFHGADEIASMP